MSGSDRFPGRCYDTKFRRVDNDQWEVAQEGVEYYCNDQYGGIYGTIFRRYYGALADLDEIAVPGIAYLIDFAFMFSGTIGHGASTDGTNTVWLQKDTDKIVAHCAGTAIDAGWVDYIKS